MHDPARQLETDDRVSDAPPPFRRQIARRVPIAGISAILSALVILAATASPAAAAPPDADNPPAANDANKTVEAAEVERPKYSKAVVIRFEGVIESNLEKYLYRKLAAAKELKPDLLVIEIESPGGEVVASFDIAETLRDVHWAHTVAYIPKNAYSGAAVVAMGCDEIIIAPTGQLGDVGVIFFDEGSMAMQYVEEKMLSVWVGKFRDLAAAKGRSPALAEAMMDRKKEIHIYRNTRTGQEQFMTDADATAAGPEWSQGAFVAETSKDRFLTVGGKRADELNLADGLADNRAAMLEQFGVDNPPIVMQWTAVDTTVIVLNHPWVTGLLIVVGLIALYIEFSAPGIGVGGLVAGLCFVLFFWSRFMGGTAEWLEVILFLAGLVFLGVELFVLPGFGVAGLTGLLLIVASVVLASQDFILPENEAQAAALKTNLMVVAISGVSFFAAAIVVSRYFGMIPVLRALRLEPPSASLANAATGTTTTDDGIPLAVGATGHAHTALRPGGKATIDGRIVDVVADSTFIDRGQAIEVVEIAGTRVVVREA
ncbi:MAG: NfeD family protein [Pirellulales bacterium]